jgi:hypothetical protein
METVNVVICLVFALLMSFIVVRFGLYIRRHPEKMSGYNTMPREKLDKINLPRVGRFVSNMMFAAIPFMLSAPFMPNVELSVAMLSSPLLITAITAALYINIFKKKFYK